MALACGGGQAQTGTVGTPRVNNATSRINNATPRGGAHVILDEELAGGAADIVVYQDGVKTGGPSSLELVTTISGREIRCLDAADAIIQFGTGHPMGAILVTMKRS